MDEISKELRKGQLIILESTTYPGTTEEVILPPELVHGLGSHPSSERSLGGRGREPRWRKSPHPANGIRFHFSDGVSCDGVGRKRLGFLVVGKSR